jgi:hypothetical protein
MNDAAYRDERAHQLHALGLIVLPMHYPVADHCSCRAAFTCGSPAKHPAVTWRAVPEQSRQDLTAMLCAYPRHNLGVKLSESRVVVLDVDPSAAGHQALRDHEERRGESLPQTLTVTTAGAGRHLYYRLPPDSELPGQVIRWLHGVDARTNGVMVIPPSIGMNLREYAFTSGSATTPAVIPTDIVDRLAAVPTQRPRDRRPHPTLHVPGRQDRAIR